MKITIKATNLKLTPSLRSYAEEKIRGLEKFIHKIGFKNDSSRKGNPSYEAWVEIGKTTRHHYKGKVFRAECQIRFPGKSIRAESIKTDLRLAIDEVRDELQRELNEYAKKRTLRYRKTARRIKRLIRFSSLSRFRRRN